MWLWCRCFLQMLYIVVRNCVFLAKWKWNWTFLQNLVRPLTGSTMTIGMNADPFSTSSSLPWMAPELSKRITFACLAQAPHCQAIWQFVDVLMNGARGWCYATTAQGWRRGGVNVPCAWRAQDDVIEVQVPFAAPMIRVQSGMQRWRKRWVLCWVQLILVRSSDLCIYNIHTSKQKTLLQKKQKTPDDLQTFLGCACQAALGEHSGSTRIYRVQEPSTSQLHHLKPEDREDPVVSKSHKLHNWSSRVLRNLTFEIRPKVEEY